MMPGALGAPVEVHIDGGQACGGATSHPSGGAALAAELDSPEGETWFPYRDSGSAAGPSMGSLDNNGIGRDTYFHPVTNGFRGIVLLRPTPTLLDYRLRTWDLAGQLVSDLALQAHRIAPLPDGGSLAVLAPPPPSPPGSAPGNPTLAWIDASGNVTGTMPFDNDVDEVIVNWPTGHIFATVVGLSFRPAQGRWYDAAGSPLSSWFDLPIGKAGGYERLLADGVVAVGTIGGSWLTAVRDGAAGTEAVPAWLAARPGTRLATIRGGRGYAVLPATGMDSFEIVAADGESCGTVTVPQPSAQVGGAGWSPPRLDVGWDGTVFQTFLNESLGSPPPGPQRCVYRWWPALLR